MKAKSVFFLVIAAVLSACHGGRRQQMSALLDEADSLNRAYQPVTALGQPAAPADSLLLEAARFYDRHGTPNERLRAYYLLGCAYRDLGQAPEALQAYQDAVDRADTTATDSASLHHLMAVYGQMADLFDAQNLPHDELSAIEKYGRVALLAKDTFCYIRNIELMVRPYDLLDDTISMARSLRTAHHLFEEFGMQKEAAGTLSTIIFFSILQNNLDEARRLMDIYEAESELFDACGNIETGRETYYYIKGLYYLRRDSLEQAEVYMRKLIDTDDKVNAYRGLMSIYRQRNLLDSVTQFSLLFEQAIDTLNKNIQTEVMHQMSSLYNYQHHQKLADKKTREAMRLRLVLFVVIFSTLATIGVLSMLIIRARQKRRTAQIKYVADRQLLERTKLEVKLMQAHQDEFETVLAEKMRLIENLNKELAEFRYKESNQRIPADFPLKDDDTYHYFHTLAIVGQKPTDSDWENLYILIEKHLPNFRLFLQNNKYTLNENERRTCMLSCLHISPSSIANMLGVSSAYISKIRRRIVSEVFKAEGGSKLFDGLIQELC